MAPKPFNPPRPTGEISKAGRPKGSTNSKPRKSTSTSSSTKPKASKDGIDKPRKKKSSDVRRLSTAALAKLGGLSSDSDNAIGEDDDEDMGDEDGTDEEVRQSISTKKSKSHPKRQAANVSEPEDDPFASQPIRQKTKSRPSNEGSPPPSAPDRKEAIPSDLINVLLHEFFREKGGGSSSDPRTRMTKEANAAVGKYIDTFVREAVARAAWEGEERGTRGAGFEEADEPRGVLEVEDLERLAPQMILDF